MGLWSGTDRTDCGPPHVPLGAACVRVGLVSSQALTALTLLRMRDASSLASPRQCIVPVVHPWRSPEPAQAGYTIFLNSIRLPAYFFHLFTVLSGVFLFI